MSISESIPGPMNPPLVISRDLFFRCFALFWTIALVGYTWNSRGVMSANDASRWDTVWSLVEYRTYEIFDTPQYGDKQQLDTIDKVVRRHDQKTISSKPPLLPTVLAGFIGIMKPIVGQPITKDLRIPDKPSIPGSINIYTKLGIWVFQILPFLGTLWLYKRFLDALRLDAFTWTVCLFAAGFGTLVTGYLVTLNNHVIAATSGLAAMYHLWRILAGQKREWWRFAFVGLLAGWTAANELPAGVFVVGIGLTLLYVDFKKAIFGFGPTIAFVTAAFFLTNFWAVGDPNDPWNVKNYIPAYLQKDLYQKDANGQPSYWARKDKSGIDALNDHPEPIHIYALHSLVGHHGVFSLSPILFYAVIGIARGLVGRSSLPTVMAWIVMLASAAVFGFYMLVSDQRNYGGFCHGLRWMQWLSLIWLLYLPSGIAPWVGGKQGRWLIGAALAISMLSMFDSWYSPWSRSWIHRVLLFHGVIDY
ncbi:hypothetical protein K2X85_19520 [bacterium]|nr:hypothetical protein [bacterium]